MKRVPFELETEESKDINNEVSPFTHYVSIKLLFLDFSFENSESP